MLRPFVSRPVVSRPLARGNNNQQVDDFDFLKPFDWFCEMQFGLKARMGQEFPAVGYLWRLALGAGPREGEAPERRAEVPREDVTSLCVTALCVTSLGVITSPCAWIKGLVASVCSRVEREKAHGANPAARQDELGAWGVALRVTGLQRYLA